MVFFKSDPGLQPPGVAVVPQCAVPLESSEASLPSNFRRSFSVKPRKPLTGYEVRGFEMKLSHR